MKNSIIFVIALHLMTLTVYGQKKEVPGLVKKAFEQRVPNPKSVEWEFNSEDKLWEVEYKIGKEEFTSAFDENGKWVETEKEMKFSKLPEQVKATIKADYSQYKVDEVEYVESPDGIFYEIKAELVKDKKELEFEILISLDGKVIQVKEEEEDKD